MLLAMMCSARLSARLSAVSACCWLVAITVGCGVQVDAQQPPPAAAEELAANSKPAASNETAAAIAGHWTGVPELQTAFDDASPDPDYLGRLDTFEIELTDMPKFWADNELQPLEKSLKQLASKRKHKILATGAFGATGERLPTFGYGLITQTDGQTFLSVIAFDPVDLMPWRLHYIPGKNRGKDMLIVEIDEPGQRQIAIFRRSAETPSP
jgi:hypothetical protein